MEVPFESFKNFLRYESISFALFKSNYEEGSNL